MASFGSPGLPSMNSLITDKLSNLGDIGGSNTPNSNADTTANNWWITPPGMFDPKPTSLSYNREFLEKTQNAWKNINDPSSEYFKFGIQQYRNSLDEDPTILGFDLRINFYESPLFNNGQLGGLESTDQSVTIGNGPMDSFFRWASTNGLSDITSRKNVYIDFLDQFRLFFNGITRSDEQFGFKGFKSHYVRKITGLDKLVEKIGGPEQKQFIDFGKDIITISMYEDVGLNSGWMAMLYKTLSWSRLNGRNMIPDNLLRFDMDIIVSEVRNYNKVVKAADANSYDVVRDNVSRYVYSLYECQLIFDDMSHAGDVDVTQVNTTDTFDFSIKYKLSTTKMEKFSIDMSKTTIGTFDKPGTVSKRYDFINNKIDTGTNGPGVGNSNSSKGNTIGPPTYGPYIKFDINSFKTPSISSLDSLKDQPTPITRAKGYFEKKGEELVKLAKRDAAAIANVFIISRARLLSDAIDKVRNNVNLGRLRPPTNVYTDNPTPAQPVDFLKNEIRGFIGGSLDDFLGAANKGAGNLLGGNKII